MITSRILPPAEWSTLDGTALDPTYAQLNPETSRIIVVEDAGLIVGCWAVFPVLHCEGVWIHEAYRGKISVVRRLLGRLRQLAELAGMSRMMTGCASDQVRDLLTRLDAERVPFDQFVLNVETLPCLQR